MSRLSRRCASVDLYFKGFDSYKSSDRCHQVGSVTATVGPTAKLAYVVPVAGTIPGKVEPGQASSRTFETTPCWLACDEGRSQASLPSA